MANYYTKDALITKVQQLEEATGSKMQLVSCNKEYAIQSMGGPDLGFVGWYHPIKELIIYVDGFLAGMNCGKSARGQVPGRSNSR